MSKDKRLTVYLQASTFELLQEIAKSRGRSLSNTVGLSIHLLDLMGEELFENEQTM